MFQRNMFLTKSKKWWQTTHCSDWAKKVSVDLKQGRLELPADFCFTPLNEKMFLQMKEKTLEEVQRYEKEKKEVEQEKEKKGKRN